MGGCLSRGGGHDDDGSVAPKGASKKHGASDQSVSKRAAAAATAAVASGEDQKVRARRRAIQALVESLQHGDSVIPNSAWRGQYLKTAGIGPAVVSAVVTYIKEKNAATAAAAKSGRAKHQIRTLDLRALRAGDDSFVEMLVALLDDRLVENVIFAGNEITDVGVHKLVAHMETRRGGAPASASAAPLPCALKFIGLTDNLISSNGIAALATVAALFSALEQLEVGRGQSGGGEDMDEVRDTLSMENVKAVATYIQHTPTLSTFLYKGTGNYYARTGFPPDGLAFFADVVVGHSGLRELYLQDCYTTKPSMIGPLTVQAPRGKSAAAAAGGGATPPPDDMDSTWSAEQIQKSIGTLATALCLPSSQLATLVLRFPLSDEAVQTLARGLARAPHLANLSLRGCDMSHKALSAIGEALVSNRALRMLDVSYQSNSIAHPAYLLEIRNSSKRRYSYSSSMATAYSAADIARQELNGGGSDFPSREERQHPMLPIIRALRHNRALVQLVMIGVNVSTEDIEELCACMERSGNKTLSEVWYTNAGNDALKMKLEDLLAVNREYGEGGDNGGGVGPSAVSSVRSSAVRVYGSSANFFPDSTSHSDRTESTSRQLTEKSSTVRNTGTSIPYSQVSAPQAFPHHPPRSGAGTNGGDSYSAERRAAPSLSTAKIQLRAGTAAEAANGATRSVGSAAAPSQVKLSIDDGYGQSAIAQRSRTLRFTGSERVLGSVDGTDEAHTMPYTSNVPAARKARGR